MHSQTSFISKQQFIKGHPMTTIAQLPHNKATSDPASVFASPNDIVHEILLTRGEKIATLKRWRADIVAQLQAGGEGMCTNRTSARHSELLTQVEKALAMLQELKCA